MNVAGGVNQQCLVLFLVANIVFLFMSPGSIWDIKFYMLQYSVVVMNLHSFKKHLRQFVQSDWFLPVFISHDKGTLRIDPFKCRVLLSSYFKSFLVKVFTYT